MHSGADMDASSAATTRDIEAAAASQGSGDNPKQEDKALGMDSQCHENTPMDSEYQKLKLESAMNQLTLDTGTGNQQAPSGMNNRQPHSSMSTTTCSQQMAGSRADTQNHQSPALGVIRQESVVVAGMNNRQTHSSMSTTTSSQEMEGSGVDTQNHQSPASRVIEQESIVLAMKMKNQQTMTSRMSNQPGSHSGRGRQLGMSMGVCNQQARNSSNRPKKCGFALLLPVIQPLLDRDRALQLQSLYQTFKRNEITQEAFVRRMRTIVGDQMLKMLVYKLQQQAIRGQCNLRGSVPVNRNVCASVRMGNAPMAEMPNNPPLQQNAFQFYTGITKVQTNIAPLLPMTYAKSEPVETDSPGNSENDGFEMQFSKLGVSTCTSKVYCDIPGWMELDNYAPSREEKLLFKENLEQLGRSIAKMELELANCKAERDFMVDSNLVLKQELENEKMLRQG